jgi:predicted short-subunit dehydrogenase-like oxidoreductase (DUF2520 family)
MATKPAISIVGAGNLARALAPALRAAGYPIAEIISRDHRESLLKAGRLARAVGARAVRMTDAQLGANVVWFCVSDASIRSCSMQLAKHADWKRKYALHSSGAFTSDELSALHREGAEVASLHPMMTFVRRNSPPLKGISFAVEGNTLAVAFCKRVVRDLGGAVFDIGKEYKALYHAWGAFGSPLVVMELAVAEQVAEACGISRALARKTIEPLVRRTIENYFSLGASAAFSGPMVRGDVDTVCRHLQKLTQVPGAREVYLALARSALETLPVERRQQFKELFDKTELESRDRTNPKNGEPQA